MSGAQTTHLHGKDASGNALIFISIFKIEYEICFTGKTTVFRRDFQTLNTRAGGTVLSSNVHQFFKQKSYCFMRETAVKRISFFPGIFYVVWGLLSRGSSYLTSGIPFLVSWPLALLVLMCSERGFVGKKTHEPCLLFQIGLTFFRRNKRYQ